MAEEHWFDALHKRLMGPTPRREVLRAAAALAVGLLGSGAPEAEAAKKKTNKKKQNSSKKKNSKKKNKSSGKNKSSSKNGTKTPPTAPGGCTPPCPAGRTCCDNTCVDTQTNDLYCGGCLVANICGPEQICDNGHCVCPDGRTFCENTLGAGCVDTQTDTYHCGACGNFCPDGSCLNGHCSSCPPGQEACGDIGCVDTQTDPNNCGGCGNVCGAGETCENGQCVPGGCVAGQYACGAGWCCYEGSVCCPDNVLEFRCLNPGATCS